MIFGTSEDNDFPTLCYIGFCP